MSKVEQFVNEVEKEVVELGAKVVSNFDKLSLEANSSEEFYQEFKEALAKKSPTIKAIVNSIIENFEL